MGYGAQNTIFHRWRNIFIYFGGDGDSCRKNVEKRIILLKGGDLYIMNNIEFKFVR